MALVRSRPNHRAFQHRRKIAAHLRTVIDSLENRRLFSTTYYVSPSGDDGQSGTSIATAWNSIDKVNSIKFQVGDEILFEGGATFDGGLSFGSGDQGTASSPIIVSSYGNGRATIRSGSVAGVYVLNAAGIDVTDLNFVGSGRTSNDTSGIEFLNTLSGDVKLDHVTIDDCDVSGYGDYGVRIGGWNGASAFKNIRVTDSFLHDNGRGGMTTYAMSGKSNQNVYVGRVRAYNNSGVASDTTTHTGDGIVLGYVDGVIIERCVAHDNGWLNAWSSGGPVGIWVFEANNAVIQNNESYHNRTGSAFDGGGFDFDGGTTNSVMQYNYSHDNDGSGYLLGSFPGASACANNVVRYNISQNDGRANSYGSIFFYGSISNVDVYNNTVWLSQPATGNPAAFKIVGGTNIRVRNNLFVTTGGLALVKGKTGSGRVFQGNDYWSGDGKFTIVWDGVTYTSLSDWQDVTGQEELNGAAVGMVVDPKLVNAGGGGTLGDATLLETNLDAYKLQSSSPLMGKGLDLTSQFGIDVGVRDFFGDPLPTAGFEIGVDEVTGTIVPDTTPPAAPTGLTSEASTSGIALDWSDNTEADLAGYNIYRSDALNGTYIKLTAQPQTDSAFNDTTSPGDAVSYYRVTALDTSGNESAFASTNATRPPVTPGDYAIIGTAGSYKNLGNTIDNAFDGDTDTFFDATISNGNWVGIDLGTAAPITSIRFFPRSGYESRMLNGKFQGSNSADFSSGVHDLFTIDSTPGLEWNEQSISDTTAFRYVRYLAPGGSYGNVAELQISTSSTKFVGTPIGTVGSYNDLGNTLENAFDGDLATFFDSPTTEKDEAWVGLDLGDAQVIHQINYAPRANYASRMVGGQFQGSNSADFSSGVTDLFTITTTPTIGMNQVDASSASSFRYVRYLAPENSFGNVAEIEFS